MNLLIFLFQELMRKAGSGHKDFEVKLGKGITLQQDQMRRETFG